MRMGFVVQGGGVREGGADREKDEDKDREEPLHARVWKSFACIIKRCQ